MGYVGDILFKKGNYILINFYDNKTAECIIKVRNNNCK